MKNNPPKNKIGQIDLTEARLILSKKEYELLEFMLTFNNQIISKHALLEVLWNYNEYTNTNTLEVHISTLRKKLKKIKEYLEIQTVHGTGYRLLV